MDADEVFGIAVGVALVAAVVAVTLGVGAIIGKIECDNKAGRMGKAHEYRFIGGCMIEDKGVWIPLENYRVF